MRPRWLRRRGWRVTARCRCGAFVPGMYDGSRATTWGCDDCGVKFTVSPR